MMARPAGAEQVRRQLQSLLYPRLAIGLHLAAIGRSLLFAPGRSQLLCMVSVLTTAPSLALGPHCIRALQLGYDEPDSITESSCSTEREAIPAAPPPPPGLGPGMPWTTRASSTQLVTTTRSEWERLSPCPRESTDDSTDDDETELLVDDEPTPGPGGSGGGDGGLTDDSDATDEDEIDMEWLVSQVVGEPRGSTG